MPANTTLSQIFMITQLTPVRLCSASNISGTYNNGSNGVGATLTVAASSLTIDSNAVVVGDRVLLQGQSAGAQNGIYDVYSIGSTVVLRRSGDFQSIEQLQLGQWVPVFDGTVFSGRQFCLIDPLPGAIGVDNIVFASPQASFSGVSVDGDFAMFSDTAGSLIDDGISPSDASKDKVVMANAAVLANHIAVFVDTAGTVDDDIATAINAGNIQAGLNGGTGGALISAPAGAASGSLRLVGVANAGNFNISITNASHGQATAYAISDAGVAAASILTAPIAAADPGANLICFDVACGQAALAAGGLVALVTSSGAKQYKVRALWGNSGGTNFSGGGGDRLLAISDGTTVYSLIPAASIQTLVNTGWGISAALPFPAAAAINTSTVAGQNLRALYSGGAADYTAGSVVISGMVQRVA